MSDIATAQLNAHLAGTRKTCKNHATFQRQQQQISAMVLLLSGIITGILANSSIVGEHPRIFRTYSNSILIHNSTAFKG